MSGPATAATALGGPRRRPYRPTVSRRRLGWVLPMAVAALALTFMVAPLIYLCMAPLGGQLMHALHSEFTLTAMKVSLVAAAISTVLVVMFGTPLAYVLARVDFRGKPLVDTLIDLPMVLPPMVTGIALLIVFGRNGPVGAWLGEWGITVTFTMVAVVLAQTFVALPFYVRAARAGFEGMDRRLELASLLLGASRLSTFLRVTVPTTWPSLLAGTVLAWARCLGEFGATIVFAGNFEGTTQTMPLAIFAALQHDTGFAVALSLILLGVSFVLVLLLKLLAGKAAVTHA